MNNITNVRKITLKPQNKQNSTDLFVENANKHAMYIGLSKPMPLLVLHRKKNDFKIMIMNVIFAK